MLVCLPASMTAVTVPSGLTFKNGLGSLETVLGSMALATWTGSGKAQKETLTNDRFWKIKQATLQKLQHRTVLQRFTHLYVPCRKEIGSVRVSRWPGEAATRPR